MPYCPICRTDYDASIKICPVCQIPLADESKRQQDSADAGELVLVELAEFFNVAEAEMLKELLEQNDIRVILRGEVDPIGVTSGAAPTTLLVEEKDLLRGRELYEAYFSGDGIEENPSDQEA